VFDLVAFTEAKGRSGREDCSVFVEDLGPLEGDQRPVDACQVVPVLNDP
jgi:hypothetical protein